MPALGLRGHVPLNALLLIYCSHFCTSTWMAHGLLRLCRSVDKSTAQSLSQPDLLRSPPSLLVPSR